MRLHGSCTTDQGAPRFDHEWQRRAFGLAIALSNSATIAQLPAAVRGRSRRYLYRRGHKGEKPPAQPTPVARDAFPATPSRSAGNPSRRRNGVAREGLLIFPSPL